MQLHEEVRMQRDAARDHGERCAGAHEEQHEHVFDGRRAGVRSEAAYFFFGTVVTLPPTAVFASLRRSWTVLPNVFHSPTDMAAIKHSKITYSTVDRPR